MTTTAEQEALQMEAARRVERALDLIEDAQGKLNDACAVLSSLRHAAPEWRATIVMADKAKAHWYRVRNALQLGSKARKVSLDPLATETVLARMRSRADPAAEASP